HGTRLVSPSVRILRLFKFLDKFCKRCMSLANAGTITQYRVERRRLTIVVHPDLFITLYGACARSEAQQSDGGKCRPEHGSEIQSLFHRNQPLSPCRHEGAGQWQQRRTDYLGWESAASYTSRKLDCQ